MSYLIQDVEVQSYGLRKVIDGVEFLWKCC